MKCPKCSYISFDYNERCPNCNRDLDREKKAFDLIAFKHNPPSLLQGLTGDFADMEPRPAAGSLSADTSVEGEDLDMHFDREDLSESLPEEEFSLDLADLEVEIGGPEASAFESLGSGNISLDATVPELHAPQEISLVDSAEMLTAKIANKKQVTSDDQKVKRKLDPAQATKPADEVP